MKGDHHPQIAATGVLGCAACWFGVVAIIANIVQNTVFMHQS